MRSVLRGLPVLKGAAPPFDPVSAPADPVELFGDWFLTAVEAGVTEPHAMTLSTVAPTGHPSARVLILKDVDADGWHFAINAVSAEVEFWQGAPDRRHQRLRYLRAADEGWSSTLLWP
ncbi:pyridoxine 5'-phosphate oxidase C-terminal domain-containing protein [Nocardia takedensis]|uniref:pyridoxine 5'-phosphate oxidase C-terminal domain-containing protein n=1 Tax=Nocardia takedensis TaxID=259390 RepID=UPI0009FC744D|nr:pyridoxine 5'-phosphate oxidase C-terminal domain-containing protein [Nocardia takedensis]